MSEEEIAAARKEFELSLLFDKYQLVGSTGTQRLPDGQYVSNFIEAAWRGYLMCWERQNDLLDRLDPMRYIGPGLVGAFKEVSMFEFDESQEDEIHDSIRAALSACRGTPC